EPPATAGEHGRNVGAGGGHLMANTMPAASPRAPSGRLHSRSLIAWAAVALTLAAAILGALQGGSEGLILIVSTLAGGATDTLQVVGDAVPLGYAFGVGMAAAVNPCGFALLPTYLGLYLGSAAGDRRAWPAQLGRALLISATMTASFVVLFG